MKIQTTIEKYNFSLTKPKDQTPPKSLADLKKISENLETEQRGRFSEYDKKIKDELSKI